MGHILNIVSELTRKSLVSVSGFSQSPGINARPILGIIQEIHKESMTLTVTDLRNSNSMSSRSSSCRDFDFDDTANMKPVQRRLSLYV